MVVVGIASYKDRSEAYPLDKKTLKSIALRSFLVKAGKNGETGESVGWAWAMAPGLKKIHTDEEDYALALGHHLEYVDTGYMLAPFAMGILLAMEQQKPDLETLRSVKTMAAGLCRSLSHILMCIALPWIMMIAAKAIGGNTASVVLYAACMVLVSVILRFALLRIGYSQGTRIAEKTAKDAQALKNTAVYAGAFMIGAVIAVIGAHATSLLPSVISAVGNGSAASGMTAFIPLGMTMLLLHLLERKNWSLGKCALLIVAVSAVIACFMIVTGVTSF